MISCIFLRPYVPRCSNCVIHYSYHPGGTQTLHVIRQRFWWPVMSKDVKEFVMACLVCAQAKSSHKWPSKLLHPLPVPRHPWSHISLDFVTGLPVWGHDGDVNCGRQVFLRLFIWVEYAHNSLPLAPTGLSFFQIIFGYKPVLFLSQEKEVQVLPCYGKPQCSSLIMPSVLFMRPLHLPTRMLMQPLIDIFVHNVTLINVT